MFRKCGKVQKFWIAVKNQNCIQEDIKSKLNS